MPRRPTGVFTARDLENMDATRRVDMVLAAIKHVRILADYECAGIDLDPDDTRLCGKCGPCEAGAFLERWGL
jgi:hypothetical protein